MKLLKRFFALAALVAAGWFITGCASHEPDNLSTRPWNSAPGYAPGLPMSLNEGR